MAKATIALPFFAKARKEGSWRLGAISWSHRLKRIKQIAKEVNNNGLGAKS